MRLGDISAYFESGNTERSVGTISYNKSDPGGKSYGKYQIAARTGTLKKYIAWSVFTSEFQGVHPASSEFDAVWKRLAEEKPEEFERDQYQFIVQTHYNPVERAAKPLGFDVTNVAVQEALFSIGVQHGGYKTILREAVVFRAQGKTQIEALYEARRNYVNKLSLSQQIKSALQKRYDKEYQIVKILFEGGVSEVELFLHKNVPEQDPEPPVQHTTETTTPVESQNTAIP